VRKLAGNRTRDAAATEQLTGLGWTVLRLWKHQDPEAVVARIAAVLAERAVHRPGTGRGGGVSDRPQRPPAFRAAVRPWEADAG